jgi:mono/diheme cytochrome c family protein
MARTNRIAVIDPAALSGSRLIGVRISRLIARVGRIGRVKSRFGLAGLLSLLAMVGCDEAQNAGPITYRDHERFAKDLADKPKLQATIRKALATVYGEDVRHMKVPENSGLRDDGRYLGNFVRIGDQRERVTEKDPKTGKPVEIEGGYALYRKNCLHCHGVFGAGDGPTSAWLFPRPRDYRRGVYKFTSTNPVDAKPSRADLRKTILYGLHGTSMPGFEALMSSSEIEQVIDYMTFLSMRGETERYLIDEAMTSDDKDADSAIDDSFVSEIVTKVTSSWKEAETQVVNPTTRWVKTRESILRGRDLYLASDPKLPKVECVSCHGASGQGNGASFIDTEIFRDAALRQWPLDQAIAEFYKKQKDRAAAESGTSAVSSPDPQGVAKFLEENPAVVDLLRKERKLTSGDASKGTTEKLDPGSPFVVEARRILPELDDAKFRPFLLEKMVLWSKSLDVWDNPLRPANLLEGTYKGGRRPIDLYWRIAKGINGVKMPAHAGVLSDDQIWDVVNFVLAVPEDRALLPESLPKPGPAPGHSPSVAASR